MAEIFITDLTTGVASGGTGSFDKLMESVEAHLEREFNAGRITGGDYSTVYLGSLQAVLQQAIAFELGRQQADKQAALLVEQASATNAQIAKFAAETALLEQKKLTEEAQINDTVSGQSVAGVLGKQKALYTAQTDGFQRDAEQKLLREFLNTWSVRRTTDEGTTVSGNGLSDVNIKQVVDAARAGIGLPAST